VCLGLLKVRKHVYDCNDLFRAADHMHVCENMCSIYGIDMCNAHAVYRYRREVIVLVFCLCNLYRAPPRSRDRRSRGLKFSRISC
jgi:hypothetical protein